MGERSVDVLRDELLARVERTTENTLAPGSKKSYSGSVMRYLSWLYVTGEAVLDKHLLSVEFRQGVVGDAPTKEYMRAFLKRKPRVPPLDFAAFSGSDFTMWLAALQAEAETKTGKPLTRSTMGGHRSALRFLFSEHKLDLDDFTDKAYSDFFCGLKRDTASLQGNGVGKALVGKLPLTFKAYVALCGSLLASGNAEDVFAHYFLTLQWNLMCRSANTASVCFAHVAWRDDALGVVFPRMKNDQTGERPREPRHVYANPVEPTICPILSTAMYFLTFPSITGNRIFPGDSQPERFRKRMHAVLSRPPLSTLLTELGLSPDDIGTHSVRKGSATYCSSGSTACPSSAAIRYRAGWSTGAVHERYCQYESAGDQHVGRTACGLPVDTPEFAALPPHFVTIDDNVIDAVQLVYPSLHRIVPSLACFCLASLIYHDGFLTASLPLKHPVRQSQYFKDSALKQRLASGVVCRAGPNDALRPTGVPPQVNMQVQVNEMAAELRTLIAAVRSIPDAVAASLSTREAQVDGPLMRSDLRGELGVAMREFLAASGIIQSIESINARLAPTPPCSTDEPTVIAPLVASPTIRGRFVRENYTIALPKVTLMSAWQLWFVGPPPLRFVSSHEMRSDDDRKRLSDLAFVMQKLNERVPGFPANSRPTMHEVNDAFYAATRNFELFAKTPKGRTRRVEQIKWTSAATLLRMQHARLERLPHDLSGSAN